MAATNPYRVRDLLHTYGWDFIPRLAALGINYQAEAQVLFVDSGATNALDADDTIHGHSFENPLATIDYAIGLCTASEGSVILVAPGHNEGLGNAQIDFDVAGITCIGLGNGNLRPRIDFDHANASIVIGANGVTLVNFGFLPSVTGVLIGVDVESGVTNFKMVECEFMAGEDGSNVDEFAVTVDLKANNHDTVLKNNVIRSQSGSGGTTGIKLTAGSNRVLIEDNTFIGKWSGYIIDATAAASTELVVRGNMLHNADTTAGKTVAAHASSTGEIIDNVCYGPGPSVNPSGAAMVVRDNRVWSLRIDDMDSTVRDNILKGWMAYAMKSIGGSAATVRFWFVDANIAASGDGKSPQTAFKTIDEAITAANDSHDDWIFVYDYSGSTATITINKSFVHLIGHGNVAYPWPRIKPSNDVAGITLASKSFLEIKNFVIGGNTNAPGITAASGIYPTNVHIHDCVFGWDASSTCQDGINIASGADLVRGLIENNRFLYSAGAGITRDGIRLVGNATRSIIRNNEFLHISGVGVNLSATGIVEVEVAGNKFQLESDTAGSAVYVASGCDKCYIHDNDAAFGVDGPYEEVFQDASVASTNDWSHNTGDGGLERFRKQVLEIVAARQFRAINGSTLRTKIWYVDANIAASGDGKSPSRAFKTIDEAIAVCSDSHEDWIFVYDYSGSTGTITINKSWVHLVGYNASGRYPFPRIKPSTDVPGITLSNGVSGIEICNFKIGGNTNAAGIYCGVGAASYVTVHDCVFGADTATACQHAVEIVSGGDMPQLVFEDNWIGASCSAEALKITGVCTRGIIRKNLFLGVGTTAAPAISVAGASWLTIMDNVVNMATDAGTGGAITLGASVVNSIITGNVANDGKNAVGNDPFVDGGSTNGWGINYADKTATLPA